MSKASSTVSIDHIVETLGGLSESQLNLISEMAEALNKEIQVEINPASDIATERFSENFANRLIIHHATHEEKLKKKAFEYAFHHASLFDGKTSEIVSSQTNPGMDVIVDGTNYSLKSESAAGISKTKITISKLMEARWIRECDTRQLCADQAKKHILSHLSEYEKIITLRSFSCGVGLVKYQLVEIPKSLLELIGNLEKEDFKKPGKKSGGSSAKVLDRGRHVFTLRLDGSVEKITISSLATSECIQHAEWIVPTIT